jgi:hypothetical protein
VPFTADPGAGTAIVGEPVLIGLTEPVHDLLVRRTGGQIDLAWAWPPSVNLVEIVYTPSNGRDVQRRRLSRGQYAESRCRLPIGPDGGKVSVRAITRSVDGEIFSAPASAVVEGSAVVLTYHLDRIGGPFSRSRRLRVSVDRACRGVELKLVAARGVAMPAAHEQGRVLHHFTGLDLTPGEQWDAAFELPKGLPKPYWLRCFVLNPVGVRVADPILEMKVS